MNYLSNCTVIKNEYPFYIEHYKINKALGSEFFLYLDRSTEGLPLAEYFKNHNDVQVIHFPEPNRHADAWAYGVNYFKGKSKWVNFSDCDQVVVPLKTNDVKVMLQNYEACPSLGLNWHTFGSNGLDFEPDISISSYEAYTKRAEGKAGINNHIQSIVQVDHIIGSRWHDPHHPPMNPGMQQFNEHKLPFKGPWNIPPTQDIGFVAHYYTRSREFWKRKCERLRCDTGTSYECTMKDFEHHQTYLNAVEDLTVKNIWNKIK